MTTIDLFYGAQGCNEPCFDWTRCEHAALSRLLLTMSHLQEVDGWLYDDSFILWLNFTAERACSPSSRWNQFKRNKVTCGQKLWRRRKGECRMESTQGKWWLKARGGKKGRMISKICLDAKMNRESPSLTQPNWVQTATSFLWFHLAQDPRSRKSLRST